MNKIILLIIFSVNVFSAIAQDCPKSQNKKAVKFFLDATDSYKSKKYYDAKSLVAKAIEEDPEFADAYFLQGNIALKKHDDHLMVDNYKKVIELCPDLNPDIYFQIGWLDYDSKNWSEAEDNLKKFLSYDKIDESNAKKADDMLIKSKLFAHPVPFDPQPVEDISTSDPEYLAYISPDNELAFFTRRFELKDKNMLTPQSVEKFMIAHLKENGLYDSGIPMDDPFNKTTTNNEGGATITVDNKHLYFTVNEKGNFDICSSDFVNGKWSEIKNLGKNINDSKQWDSQPSVSADGNTLYYASARDSISGIDIYKSTKDENGEWKKAVRLGPEINTNGNEKSPFIHSDNKTLYFSSDSLPGLGGYDIFMTKLDANGHWSKPVNLGYPINTDADEVGFFVSTDGKKGYFASNKLNHGVGYDIYSFDLYPQARPDKVYLQKGDLTDPKHPDDSKAATIEVKDAVTSKLTKIDVDSVSGRYAFVVNFDHDLILSIKKEGYVFESQYISRKDSQNYQPKKKDIELEKLEVGGQYKINDILFATNSYQINDTIKTVLTEFVEYLKLNSKLHVALHGYTDNIGSETDNMKLSENRAKTVYDYLVSKNISPQRLTYKGFGSSQPVASNSDEEGRAKNRRTVFVVTAK